jgi:probable F420-dependent oxidoreductase
MVYAGRGIIVMVEGRSMQLGAVLPQAEIPVDASAIRDYAQAVQDLGFDFLVTSDHVLGADPAGHPGWSRPQTHKSIVHEPFVLFGFIAGAAPKLGFVSSVVILPQRQAALVAKQAAEVDVLCGGKLRLGVGIGWNAVEFEALGVPFGRRARIFEEQVSLMRRLWCEESMSFGGEFHTVTAAAIAPLPIQRPIPIWVGASAPAAVKRATRIADGYLPLQPITGSGGWEQTMELVDGWLREAGRDRSSFGIEARLNTAEGTPDDWQQTVEAWRGRGATHLSVGTAGAGLGSLDQHIERLRAARATICA